LAKRSVFVIDGDGVITYVWSNDDALTLPEFDEVMDAIAAVGDGV
jgi:peroxiredoxin